MVQRCWAAGDLDLGCALGSASAGKQTINPLLLKERTDTRIWVGTRMITIFPFVVLLLLFECCGCAGEAGVGNVIF
jgi:hypothetical protein